MVFWKNLVLTILIGTIFFLVIKIYWEEEMRFLLPTPIPKNYQPVALNTSLDLENFLEEKADKPLFFHFFNPDCPCSRYNINHFRDLIKAYGNSVKFYAVLQVNDPKNAIARFRKRYQLNIPVLLDKNHHLAKKCGVYSTPQAAILDREQRLYYRGNYNKSRYCTDQNFNFAQMAVDSLLAGRDHPVFMPIATKAYGCELPSSTKQTLGWLGTPPLPNNLK